VKVSSKHNLKASNRVIIIANSNKWSLVTECESDVSGVLDQISWTLAASAVPELWLPQGSTRCH